jgi:hypothetical protein
MTGNVSQGTVTMQQRSARSPGAYPSPTFQQLTVLAGDSSGGAYLPVHGVHLPQSTGTPADLASKGIVSGDLYSNGGVICVAP